MATEQRYFYPACFALTAKDVLDMMINLLNEGDTIYQEDDEGKGYQQPLPINLQEFMQEEILAVMEDTAVQDFINEWYLPLKAAEDIEYPNMGTVSQRRQKVLIKFMEWVANQLIWGGLKHKPGDPT